MHLDFYKKKQQQKTTMIVYKAKLWIALDKWVPR